jgi:glycosyltransferase involved in cell wall biosynthesis
MKLYILFHRSFSPRYRIPQFVPFLQKHGIESALVRLSENPVHRWKQLREAKLYDAVVLQRRLLQPWTLAALRHGARSLIFDFDDAVMYRSSKWRNPHSRSRMWRFRKTIEASDLVFAGNSFLKKEAERFAAPEKIHVIPTAVDLERYTPKNHTESSGPVTIGWIGSQGTLRYLRAVMPALETISEKCRDVQLKIVCNAFLESEQIRIVKKQWEETAEVPDVKSFDVGIMPLSDDVWARGKCALKIVQYLAVGIPVVCSPVGTNRDIVSNGRNGFWATTREEWVDRLFTLIQDPSLRREMGMQGRKTVAEGYSIEALGERLVHLMRDMVLNI